MSAPTFGPKSARWGIGSDVVARWWDDPGDGSKSFREEVGVVAGFERDGQGPWFAVISFGPALDKVFPTRFPVSDVERLTRE